MLYEKSCRSYKWSFLSFLVLVICFYLLGFGFRNFIHIISGSSIVFFFLLLFSKYKVPALFVSILLATCISLELSYALYFAERVSPVILSAMQTVTFDMAFKVCVPFLKYVLPLLFCLSYLFFKSTQEINFLGSKIKLMILIILLLIPTFVTSLAITKNFFYGNTIQFRRVLFEDPISCLRDMIYDRYPLILGDFFYVVADIYQLNEIKSKLQQSVLMQGLVSPDKERISNLPNKLIIVIGESSSVTHYSVYGYDKETTPNLKQLIDKDQIVLFKNIISPASITKDSLRLSLTFATPTDEKAFYKYKNIIQMAQDIGYETIWIASTIEKGISSSYLNMLANSSEIYLDSTSLEVSRLQKGHPEDLAILPLFEKYYKKNKKQFFILHLEGSHQLYQDRYDDKDKVLFTDAANTNYDRTIHHTDRFLSKLINQLEKYNEKNVLMYFSDHGEIVNKGHGLIFASDAQYKVPFILFQHKINSNEIAEIIEKYRSKNGKFNLVNFSYVMSEIMGYKVNPDLVEQAKADGEMVFHADTKVYLFDDISSGKKPDH